MTDQPLSKTFIDVRGQRMAYHERGEGPPILFLHGNPTSSYLWRDVMPELEGRGRLIAPDLIGMGDSAKLPDVGPDTYRFTTHRDFLWAFIDAVTGADSKPVLVVHDPTTAVDAVTEARIAAGVRDFRRHRTTVLVTNSPALLAVTDRVVLLDAGRVAAEGRHAALLQDHSGYREAVLA